MPVPGRRPADAVAVVLAHADDRRTGPAGGRPGSARPARRSSASTWRTAACTMSCSVASSWLPEAAASTAAVSTGRDVGTSVVGGGRPGGRAGARPDGRRPGRDPEAVPGRSVGGRMRAAVGRSGAAGERRGRGPGHGLAEQGLAAARPTTTRSAPRVAAVSASKTGRSRTAVRVRPWTPVSAIARSTWASSRSWAAEVGADEHARRALERVAVRRVEDADGDDRRLPARGLAQRPDQRAVARRPSRPPRRPARGSAGAGATGGSRSGSTPGPGTLPGGRPSGRLRLRCPTPAPGADGCRSCSDRRGRIDRTGRDQGPGAGDDPVEARSGWRDRSCVSAPRVMPEIRAASTGAERLPRTR